MFIARKLMQVKRRSENASLAKVLSGCANLERRCRTDLEAMAITDQTSCFPSDIEEMPFIRNMLLAVTQ